MNSSTPADDDPIRPAPARWLALACAALAPLAIFLSLPPAGIGIWFQMEGPSAALHLVAGLGLGALAALALARVETAIDALRHPYVLAWAAIAALSAILSPFALVPALSLFGTPEHGMGALALLDAAALTAVAIYACGERTGRRLVVAATLVTIAGVFILDGLFREARTWAPFYFGDYLAFYAVYGAVILAVVLGPRAAARALALLCGVALIVLSDNRAGLLAVAAASVISFALYRARRIETPWTPLACVVLPLAVTAAILTVGPFYHVGEFSELKRLVGNASLASAISNSWSSMWSRAMLAWMVFAEFAHHPLTLLTGAGWGHFSEALLRNLTLVPGRLHETFGQSKNFWDAILRFDFHSHNRFVEALYAGGILTAAGALGFLGVVPRYAAPEYRLEGAMLSLSLGVLLAFWFEMPQSLAVLAVALALIAERGAGFARLGRIGSRGIAATAAVAAVLGVVGGIYSLAQSLEAGANLRDDRNLVRPAAAAPGKCTAFHAANALREVYAARLLQLAFTSLSQAKPKFTDSPRQSIYLWRLCDALRDGKDVRTLTLLVSAVNAVSGTAIVHPYLSEPAKPWLSQWSGLIDEVIARAPRRGDLAIPYLNHLLAAGRDARVLEVSGRLLAGNPESPVGLWFSGLVLLDRPPEKAEGMDRLRRGLANGINNMMPIDKAVLAIVRGARVGR